MTNFSTNQVMQFYVTDDVDKEIVKTLNGDVYIKFTYADGEVRVSDKIENVMWGKHTKKGALRTYQTSYVMSLNSEINEGAPVAGQTYVVRVSYPEVGGLGNEGWVTKTAAVTVTANVAATAADLYEELAKQLEGAFANDQMVGASATAEGLAISNIINTKGYKRGVRPIVLADFTVSAANIIFEGEEVMPFADTSFVAETTENYLKNGYKVADMEYFAMGERGDQYRNIDYVNAIDTDYKVDPTAEYDVLNVHFAYKGANQNSHKSEKDLVLVTSDTFEGFAYELSLALGVEFTVVDSVGESVLEPPIEG